MIQKTDKFLKRHARIWASRIEIDDMVPEYTTAFAEEEL